MTTSEVLYEVNDRVATITINRPERRNAVNQGVVTGMLGALSQAREDPDVWVIIVTGAGDTAFCSGADLAAMERGRDGDREARPAGPRFGADDLYQYLRHTYKPTIAAVNGYALAAGAGIALSCDMRILSDRAVMGWPHANRGISSISGPVLLAHMLGLHRALEIEYFAEHLDAQHCLELGLVNRVVPHEDLMTAALETAERIKRSSPASLRHIKEAMIRGLELPMDERIKLARDFHNRCLQTEDAREGLRAFMEKRQPVWTGR